MRMPRRERAGITLVEALIVLLILGILSIFIIPHIRTSTDDGKQAKLKIQLATMRHAVECYFAQHNNVYPGAQLGGASDAAQAFERQLTRYTDATNGISDVKSSEHRFGPYLDGGSLPPNPFNGRSSVVVDTRTSDVAAKASDGTGGWKFYAQTGVLLANDGAHDSY